jgi:hypothetical protein
VSDGVANLVTLEYEKDSVERLLWGFHLPGSVANISLNTIYSGSFKNKTTTDSGFKNICDRTQQH